MHREEELWCSWVRYAKSLQSCPTLCDPKDSSPPGSPIPGVLQARPLEWAAISFSSAWKWKVKVRSFSRVWLLAIPWTAAYQAPPSMGFSRQEYWSGVPLPECSKIRGTWVWILLSSYVICVTQDKLFNVSMFHCIMYLIEESVNILRLLRG